MCCICLTICKVCHCQVVTLQYLGSRAAARLACHTSMNSVGKEIRSPSAIATSCHWSQAQVSTWCSDQSQVLPVHTVCVYYRRRSLGLGDWSIRATGRSAYSLVWRAALSLLPWNISKSLWGTEEGVSIFNVENVNKFAPEWVLGSIIPRPSAYTNISERIGFKHLANNA